MTCSGCNGFWLGSVTAGSLWEWKGILIRNVGFSLDMATLLMALGHSVHIWWLHGMAFHLMDSVLFLNICVNISFWHSMSCSIYNHFRISDQALLGAMFKQIKGFIKLRKALGALHAALPDVKSYKLLMMNVPSVPCDLVFYCLSFSYYSCRNVELG